MSWKVISPRICRESAEVLELTLNEEHPIERNIKINWGNSAINTHDHQEVFGNKLEAVGRSSNKVTMFALLKGLGTVPLYKDEQEHNPAGYFIHNNPYGHNGSGVIFDNRQERANEAVWQMQLVTCAVPGEEYRAYFAYGKVLDTFKKVRIETERQEVQEQIHNSRNGWGYLSNPPELRNISGLSSTIREYTIKAANRMELSYGAVDFIYGNDGYVYILETNSAPTLITNELTSKFAQSIASQFGD